MSQSPIDPKDPKTWPVVSAAVNSDTVRQFGPFRAMVTLTDEQKTWPIMAAHSEFQQLGPFRNTDPRAHLVLTVRPPAGSSHDAAVENLQGLFVALEDYEVELGGTGLVIEPIESVQPGELVWRITPDSPKWAASRLRALRSAIDPTAEALAIPSDRANHVRAAVARVEHLQPTVTGVMV